MDSTSIREGLNLAGIRFWTASLLPALVGTTLPFWLHPPGFSFRLFATIEFLIAAVLFQAGFAFLLAWFVGRDSENWPKGRILGMAIGSIAFSCLIGLSLNLNLHIRPHVFEGIFLVFGLCALFVGGLYVIPPLRFYRRVGGEVVLTYSLGLLPVLGAYLVQVGDLTRPVYVAAIPVVAITGLWVWLHEISVALDGNSPDRKTLVTYFGLRFSGRFGVPAIAALFILSVLGAVFSSSISPLALLCLLLIAPILKIAGVTWNRPASLDPIRSVEDSAAMLHSLTCLIIAVSAPILA